MINQDYKIELSFNNLQFIDTLFEKKDDSEKSNTTNKLLTGGAAGAGIVGVGLKSGIGKGIMAKGLIGKGLMLGGKKSGIILINPKSKLTDSFQDEVKEYVIMVVSSVAISAALNVMIYTMFVAFTGLSHWNSNVVWDIILHLGILISLEVLVYRIIRKVLIKINNGKDLSRDQSITLLTITVGVVGFIIKTKLLDYGMESALVSSILSMIGTYLVNKMLSK